MLVLGKQHPDKHVLYVCMSHMLVTLHIAGSQGAVVERPSATRQQGMPGHFPYY